MLAEHFLQKVGVGAHGRPVDADVGAHCSQRPSTPFIDAETRRKLFRGSCLGLRPEGFWGSC